MKQITIINADGNEFTFYDNLNNTILRSFEGFEYPSVRESIEEVAGDKSAVHVNSIFGKREFSFIGDLIGNDVFTLRQSVLDALGIGSLKTIKFTTYDDLELQCEAILVDYKNPYNHSIHTFELSFISPDWRFFTQTEYEFTSGPTVVHGGAAIPANIPLSLTTVELDENCITNNGSEITDPIFTIHGPGTLFRVINQDTGEEFTITQTLTDAEELVVNVKEKTVTFDGNLIMNSFDGDWWHLVPGENCIGFIVSGSGANTLLTVNWRDAYIGL